MAMPGALSIWAKRPSLELRAYALVQVISCVYYGLYENSASEVDYRVGYFLFTVLATTLAGWEVVRMFATRIDRFIGILCGALSFYFVTHLLPGASLDTRIVLVQSAGATAICVSLALALRWFPYKLIPGTLAGLFFGVAVFWYGISLKPSWQGSWDWIAPVWMHTAAYSWLGWKLPWATSRLRVGQ